MWIHITEREHATLLAALRYWQREAVGLMDELPEDDIAMKGGTIDALTAAEIDTLCERINTTERATPEQVQRARDEYESDECEIDDGAATSRGDDGTWVSAWVWLPDEDACPGCGAVEGSPEWGTSGDGYDGYCPSCADELKED